MLLYKACEFGVEDDDLLELGQSRKTLHVIVAL